MKVGRESVACDYDEQRVLDPNVRSVSARTWLGASARVDDSAQLFEHAEVIPEPGWGGVLSLLWFSSAATWQFNSALMRMAREQRS
jgi:hypothetical protein